MILNKIPFSTSSGGGMELDGDIISLPAEENYYPNAGEFVNFNTYGGVSSVVSLDSGLMFGSDFITTDEFGNKYYAVASGSTNKVIDVKLFKVSPAGETSIYATTSIDLSEISTTTNFNISVFKSWANDQFIISYSHNYTVYMYNVSILFSSATLVAESLLNFKPTTGSYNWMCRDIRCFNDFIVVLSAVMDNNYYSGYVSTLKFDSSTNQWSVVESKALGNGITDFIWKSDSALITTGLAYQNKLKINNISISPDGTISVSTTEIPWGRSEMSIPWGYVAISQIDDSHYLLVVSFTSGNSVYLDKWFATILTSNFERLFDLKSIGSSTLGTTKFSRDRVKLVKMSNTTFAYFGPLSDSNNRVPIFNISTSTTDGVTTYTDVTLAVNSTAFVDVVSCTVASSSRWIVYQNSPISAEMFATASNGVKYFSFNLNPNLTITINDVASSTKIQKAHTLNYPCGIVKGQNETDSTLYDVYIPKKEVPPE